MTRDEFIQALYATMNAPEQDHAEEAYTVALDEYDRLTRELDEALIDRAQARKLYEEKCIELDKAVLLLITPKVEVYRAENMCLREKVKIIRQEVVRHWGNITPKWLMEELDR